MFELHDETVATAQSSTPRDMILIAVSMMIASA
jgi:hypothetical protein